MAQLFEASETGMANLAMSHLRKSQRITELDGDTTVAAAQMRLHFAIVRDGLQRQYQWNFCEYWATLAAEVRTVPPGFKAVCKLPEDCLFVREVVSCGAEQWKVIGERYLAVRVKPPVMIRYSKRVVEVPFWDSLFVNAFALHLAVACTPVLAEDETLKAELRDAAGEALMTAFPADSAEGIPDSIPDTEWVTRR